MKSLLAVLACLIASPLGAAPIVRHTWGPADQVTLNQPWAGPMTYTQTLSVTGLSGTVHGLDLTVAYGPYFNTTDTPSHAFDMIFPTEGTPVSPPLLDCRGAPGFTVAPGAPGATPIPNSTLSVTLSLEGTVGSAAPPRGMLRLQVIADPAFEADPGVRYGIGQLNYLLENAELYASSPLLCDDAGEAFCWLGLSGSQWTNPAEQVVFEHESISWQQLQYPCWYAATPAVDRSWGSIKLIYR